MAWGGDPETVRSLFWDHYTDVEIARDFLKRIAEPHPWFMAVCVNGRPVGAMTLDRGTGRAEKRAELGLVPNHRVIEPVVMRTLPAVRVSTPGVPAAVPIVSVFEDISISPLVIVSVPVPDMVREKGKVTTFAAPTLTVKFSGPLVVGYSLDVAVMDTTS